MKEILRKTNLKCPECGGEIVHDLKYDEKFCLRCGLVVSSPFIMYEVIKNESFK